MSKFCLKHPSQKLTLLFNSYVCDICNPPNNIPLLPYGLEKIYSFVTLNWNEILWQGNSGYAEVIDFDFNSKINPNERNIGLENDKALYIFEKFKLFSYSNYSPTITKINFTYGNMRINKK